MRRAAPVLLACTTVALWLGACTRAPTPPASTAPGPQATTVTAAGTAAPEAPALPMHSGAPGEAATPPGAWSLQESDPPRAAWGPPDSEGLLGFGCDRASGQLLLDRQAIGVGDDVRLVTIDADGTRIDYPAARIDAVLAPQLVVHIALDATIVDRLLQARRMEVIAGGDTIRAPAPGDALRAVVDACRRDRGT